MACVDCIHFDMCNRTDLLNCKYFEAKSDYVKLPVLVGQVVWFDRNKDGKVEETYVEKVVLKSTGLYMKLACNAMYETSCKSIGKTVFLGNPTLPT